MLKEFREFIARGNVIDLAVAVVIGAAFGRIVTSLVEGIIMPPLGLLLGRIDFSNLFINLSNEQLSSLAEAREKGLPVIAYGAFINDVVIFVIIAFVIFLIIRQINRSRREPSPSTKDCPFCRTAIPLAATKCAACGSEIPAAA